MNEAEASSSGLDHPAAVTALTAYAAMERSKSAHFEMLRALEEKYQKYGRPSADEEAELAERLAGHDRAVREFRAAVAALRAADEAAFAAVMAELHSEASRATGTSTEQ